MVFLSFLLAGKLFLVDLFGRVERVPLDKVPLSSGTQPSGATMFPLIVAKGASATRPARQVMQTRSTRSFSLEVPTNAHLPTHELAHGRAIFNENKSISRYFRKTRVPVPEPELVAVLVAVPVIAGSCAGNGLGTSTDPGP